MSLDAGAMLKQTTRYLIGFQQTIERNTTELLMHEWISDASFGQVRTLRTKTDLPFVSSRRNAVRLPCSTPEDC